MSETKNPIGRPTKYYPEICEEMIEFFERELIDYSEEKPKLVKFPTFERFSCNKRLNTETLLEWCKIHPDFSAAYKRCKQVQKDLLIEGGLSGAYKEGFTKFLAVNITDLRDKVEVENTNKNIEVKLSYKDEE